MPWIDYEALSQPKKLLVWAVVVVVAVVVATIVWLLGGQSADVPVR